MTSPDEVSLGAAILALRVELDLSQAKFAKRLGASERQVKRWEKEGAIPDEPYRSALIALGVHPGYFKAVVTRPEWERRTRAIEIEVEALRRLRPVDEPP